MCSPVSRCILVECLPRPTYIFTPAPVVVQVAYLMSHELFATSLFQFQLDQKKKKLGKAWGEVPQVRRCLRPDSYPTLICSSAAQDMGGAVSMGEIKTEDALNSLSEHEKLDASSPTGDYEMQ